MSRNVMERVLHKLCVDRQIKQRFKEDPEKLLNRYLLTQDEKNMLRQFDIAAMQAHGINPMLTLGFWFENATPPSPAAYLSTLRKQNNPNLGKE